MKIARIRIKNCDHCTATSTVLYRIQLNIRQPWVYLCPACRTKAELENINYRYGGTWKAKKRH